ncbi:acyltransferase family protein [Planctomyces sp. SH-PL62]|uniref:acyltransferase family protein n=1 Tax=Planctomyces sp. SH-PL62 TaxID=1636152 RepID=UPI00078DD8EC|nr:acyltransferase family protein [Planctomyces sp. SH-PL62]AMV40288.1 Glucans biosynthesis protein C [Planctomyces sp. SH-PL62]
MSIQTSAADRRADLDALRAWAMLLGIVLHGSLSFFPSFWMVADRRQASGFGILFSAIHGFRMPLFFVMCGFFSAMLLQRRGRGALVKHRFRRVFLPLLLGMVTIVPLTNWISGVALSSAVGKPGDASRSDAEATDIWGAARVGDLDGIERRLASGAAVNDPDPKQGGAPLLWAAAGGRAEAVELLLARGADVNAADREGGTALHAAAFLGHEKVVEALVRAGAKLDAMNKTGNTPLDVASLDEETTRYYASLLKLDLDEDGLGGRKAAIAELLRSHGATAGKQLGLGELLMLIPVFSHLWFLWFLWWLVLGYAAVSALVARLPSARTPDWLVLSPARYLWLVPLTMLPQAFMGGGGTSPFFGPDSSSGLLPIPHVLAYYAIFFGFGALYYRADDRSGRVGEAWWLPVAIGLLVVFPLGTALAAGWPGPLGIGLGPRSSRILSIFLQAAYPWLMTFGLMGMFRRAHPAENARMRYLSDSAYWLYVAHLPLIIGAQYVVRDWPIPALAKFLLIVVVVTAFLLWTYQTLVRYTWLGRFLNGPRTRPARMEASAVPA